MCTVFKQNVFAHISRHLTMDLKMKFVDLMYDKCALFYAFCCVLNLLFFYPWGSTDYTTALHEIQNVQLDKK